MRWHVVLISTASLVGTIGPAFADTWTAAYDGTINSTYVDGRTAKVYVNADHSYSVALPNGTTLKGTWSDGKGQSCFTLTDPAPAADAKPTCFPIKEYKVGDSIEGEDATGKFTGTIQSGR